MCGKKGWVVKAKHIPCNVPRLQPSIVPAVRKTPTTVAAIFWYPSGPSEVRLIVERTKRVVAKRVVANLCGPCFLEKVSWKVAPYDTYSPRVSKIWRVPFPWRHVQKKPSAQNCYDPLYYGPPPLVLSRLTLWQHASTSHLALQRMWQHASTSHSTQRSGHCLGKCTARDTALLLH